MVGGACVQGLCVQSCWTPWMAALRPLVCTAGWRHSRSTPPDSCVNITASSLTPTPPSADTFSAGTVTAQLRPGPQPQWLVGGTSTAGAALAGVRMTVYYTGTTNCATSADPKGCATGGVTIGAPVTCPKGKCGPLAFTGATLLPLTVAALPSNKNTQTAYFVSVVSSSGALGHARLTLK
jgi:hypothetical protein